MPDRWRTLTERHRHIESTRQELTEIVSLCDFTELIEDLHRPMHLEMLLDPGRTPGEGEFLLDGDWTIVVAPGHPGRAPGLHFADFLRTTFALDCPVLTRAEDPAVRLELRTDEFRRGESYAIETGPTGITVRAGSEPGFWQGLIYLEKRMEFERGPVLPVLSLNNRPAISPRIHRSFFSPFRVDDIDPDVDPYQEQMLCRLAHYSVNGIWMRALLREVVPSKVFPEFGSESERLLSRLNALTERAAPYGISMYLYMTEPRAFPADSQFWKDHPHLKGAPRTNMESGEEFALCSSTPEVQEFLRDSSRELFRRVPGLGGLILITASEYHSHCWSHVEACNTNIDFGGMDVPKRPECPRCAERDPTEVVPEIINRMEEGVHAAEPDAKVIAWNWSWTMLEPEPNRRIIRGLSPDVTLMCDFERGGRVTRFGEEAEVDEYSLSYIGPSPRMTGALAAAQEGDLDVMGKLQVCATHECGTSGYLPLPYNVHEKYQKMREFGVSGAMQTWNFGNYPSIPLEVAGWYSWQENMEDIEWFLRGVITREYGREHVGEMIEVYRILRRAFDHFPIHIALVYRNPMTRAPSYPWPLEPTGKPMAASWLPDQELGDSLVGWTRGYGPQVTQECFQAMADESEQTLPILDHVEQGQGLIRSAHTDLAACRALHHQARSADLLMRYLLHRNQMDPSCRMQDRDSANEPGSGRQVPRISPTMRTLARAEIENLRAFLPYVERSSILGFHGEAFAYLYTAVGIRSKIADLKRTFLESESR
jgi:hypothetical protein